MHLRKTTKENGNTKIINFRSILFREPFQITLQARLKPKANTIDANSILFSNNIKNYRYYFPLYLYNI